MNTPNPTPTPYAWRGMVLQSSYILLFLLWSFTGFGQMKVATLDSTYLIDFDSTFTDVNEGAFDGSGFAASPVSGQLHSDALRLTGMSDGDGTFGGDHTSGDFARGSSSGGITTGGTYAFEVETGNYSLGVQPTGSDFAPGEITVRVVNNTGTQVTSLDVSYLIWEYNDQDRANNFNFSWSEDDVAYTDISALDFTSTETAAGTPSWNSFARNTTITTNLANGDTLYLKWTSADVSGGGSRDELALDNIEVSMTSCSSSAPATQASDISFSNTTDASTDLSWTNGDGDGRIVKMNTSNSFTDPTNGNDPSANSTWQNSGEQVVYNGSGSSVTVDGLSASTQYWFRIYEYNCSGSNTTYQTSTATDNPNSETTLAPQTEVQFTSSAASVGEGSGTYNLELSISNPDGSNATTCEVAITGGSGSAADVDNYTTQTVNFPAGSSANQTVTLTITDDNLTEGDENLIFSIQNVSGGNNASAGVPSDFDLTIIDNDLPNAWINELHYDNDGADVNELVEIVIENPESYSLSDFTLSLYNGSNGETYDSETVNNITTGSSYGNFTIYYWQVAGIQNGAPDGLSLDYQGNLIQFISYEGTFTASGGPADGETSIDIGVSESGNDPSDESLQLGGGFGRMYSQFSWSGSAINTKGEENNDQVLPEIYWDGTGWNPNAPNGSTGTDEVLIDGSGASLSSDIDVDTMEINSSSSYTQSSATLTLNGDLTNNGTVTIADGASLLTTDASANLDVIDVQRTGTQYNNVFNYWSTPVNGTTYDDVWTFGSANNEYNQSDLYTYDIFNQDFSNVTNTGNSLPIGKGVAMTGLIGGGANTLTFSGTPNNGEITPAVIFNSGVEDYALLGNPYPSAIDADLFIDDNTGQTSGSANVISGTLWFWDVDITKDTFVSDDYVTYTKAGGTNNNPHGPNFNGFIAACQGFMVESTASNNALFRNSQRVAGNNSQFYKQGPIQRIWMMASSPSTTSNGILIAFSGQATDQHDQGWDGKKLKGNPDIAFYSQLDDEDYAIQALSPLTDDKTIPLGLDANVAGTYTISIDSIDGISEEVDILLEDQSTGNFYDLRENDYSLSVEEAQTIDHLVLHFRSNTTGTPSEADPTLANIWQSGGHLLVKDLDGEALEHIRVVDLSGRTVAQVDHPSRSLTAISSHSWPAGIYLVEVRSGQHLQTEKIFIQQ